MVNGVPGDTMLIENVIFTGGSSAPNLTATSPTVVNLSMSGGTSIRFRNNVIYGNNTTASQGGSSLRIFTDLNSFALISNNSVFGNITASSTGGSVVVFGTAK